MKTVTLQWYCGMYVGKPKPKGLDVYEPDECGHTFETKEPTEEVEMGICSATCPCCGSTLTQSDDYPAEKESA